MSITRLILPDTGLTGSVLWSWDFEVIWKQDCCRSYEKHTDTCLQFSTEITTLSGKLSHFYTILGIWWKVTEAWSTNWNFLPSALPPQHPLFNHCLSNPCDTATIMPMTRNRQQDTFSIQIKPKYCDVLLLLRIAQAKQYCSLPWSALAPLSSTDQLHTTAGLQSEREK